MMTVAQMIREKLDELGADGLMNEPFDRFLTIGDIKSEHYSIDSNLIPAYRHADGTYHAEKEGIESPCISCDWFNGIVCKNPKDCVEHQSWLSHKEATK